MVACSTASHAEWINLYVKRNLTAFYTLRLNLEPLD
jgi:hypothetical protein